MLIKDAAKDEIAEYLRQTRIVDMGVGESMVGSENDVADLLIRWKEAF